MALENPFLNKLGPFQRKSSTSRSAALDNYPRSGSQREKVLDAIIQAKAYGMTRDELSVALDMRESSIHPRVWELLKQGWIKETNMCRKTRSGSKATVLLLTDRAKKELGKNGN